MIVAVCGPLPTVSVRSFGAASLPPQPAAKRTATTSAAASRSHARNAAMTSANRVTDCGPSASDSPTIAVCTPASASSR